MQKKLSLNDGIELWSNLLELFDWRDIMTTVIEKQAAEYILDD